MVASCERSFSKLKHILTYSGPALAGAGPKARPGRGASLGSDFMTSSCSVNCVTIVVERRCKALTRGLSTFVRQQRKLAASDESVLC